MGVDADLDGLMRDVVNFLECLSDIDLPPKMANVRENLLERSRTRIASFSSCRSSTSPEPYLDMNAGKGLLLFRNRKDIEIEEYVGIEEPNKINSHPSRPDYYESFQEIGKNFNDRHKKLGNSNKTGGSKSVNSSDEAEDKLIEIYKTFTPAMTMNKAHKFGTLDHRVERKSFGFVRGNVRSCWIGLVGSHLLIYTSDKDKQPPEILSLRGYTARPASNTTLKDQDQARSAFEIFCPGNKTLQFTAKSTMEMNDWLAAIGRTNLNPQDRDSGMYERSMDEKIDAELSDHNESLEERYQDVEKILAAAKIHEIHETRNVQSTIIVMDPKMQNTKKCNRTNSTKKSDLQIIEKTSPPALPIRLPRRLPSLPNDANAIPTPSYEILADAYDEDDIYHKIEDFHDNPRSYENIPENPEKREKTKKFTKKKNDKLKKKLFTIESMESVTYDDVDNKIFHKNINNENNDQIISAILEKSASRKIANPQETYDDVMTISKDTKTSEISNSITKEKKISENSKFFFEKKILKNSESMEINVDKNIRFSYATYDDVIEPPPNFVTDAKSSNSKIDENSENSKIKDSKNSEIGILSKSPTKSSQKRSFLDRVRNRKDSPKKCEKKKIDDSSIMKKNDKKEKNKLEPILPILKKSVEDDASTTSTMYDDVSGYFDDSKSSNFSQCETTIVSQIDDFSNYNYPPPPRPIYVESRTNDSSSASSSPKKNDETIVEDVYDDVGNYINDNDDFSSMEKSSQISSKFANFSPSVQTNFVDSKISETTKNNSKIFESGILETTKNNSKLFESRILETTKNNSKLFESGILETTKNNSKLFESKISKTTKNNSKLFESKISETMKNNSKNDDDRLEIQMNLEKMNLTGMSSRISVSMDDKSHEEATRLSLETEHYQCPRIEPIQTDSQTILSSIDRQEELYDDIAILAEFRSRPRDPDPSAFTNESSTSTVEKITNNMKKPWNRFGSGKKINSQISPKKNQSFTEIDDGDDRNFDKSDGGKTNKLKKLINKMETSLGKQSSIKSTN